MVGQQPFLDGKSLLLPQQDDQRYKGRHQVAEKALFHTGHISR